MVAGSCAGITWHLAFFRTGNKTSSYFFLEQQASSFRETGSMQKSLQAEPEGICISRSIISGQHICDIVSKKGPLTQIILTPSHIYNVTMMWWEGWSALESEVSSTVHLLGMSYTLFQCHLHYGRYITLCRLLYK